MNMKREELIQQILLAFKDVKLEKGVGLIEAQAIDMYASPEERSEYRSRDETENWDKIPVSHLYRYWDSISFFDAEGMRFHLPVFLLLDLEYFEDAVERMFDERPVQGSAPDMEFHLTSVLNYLDDESKVGRQMREFDLERFSLLNEEQVACVIDFLKFKALGLAGNDDQRILLEKAIDHWKNKQKLIL